MMCRGGDDACLRRGNGSDGELYTAAYGSGVVSSDGQLTTIFFLISVKIVVEGKVATSDK